jgi:hypothetical protein
MIKKNAGPWIIALLFLALQVDWAFELGPLTVFHNELLLAAAGIAAAWILWRDGRLAEARPWALAFLPLLIWLLAHVPQRGAWECLKAALRALQFYLPLALAPLLLRRRQDWVPALRVALAAGTLACLWALAQSASGPSSALSRGHEIEVSSGFQPAWAGMSHHNQWGAFLVAWLALALAAALSGTERKLALAALALGLPALACSYSRGAWLGAVLVAAGIFWVLPRRAKGALLGLGALGLLAGLFGPSTAFRDRVATLFQAGDRASFTVDLLQRTQGLPVWGLGEKGLQQLLADLGPALSVNPDARLAFTSHTHNFYLQQALAWGWPVLLAWALLLMPALASVRSGWAKGGAARLWALALAGAMAGFLLQSATDLLTLHARGAAVTLCWGLLLAGLRLELKEGKKHA